MFGIFQKMLNGKDTAELKALLAEGATLLDVRTAEEVAQGAAEGAVHIPLQGLQQQIPKIKKMKAPIIAYCRSGNRSGMAAHILKAHGIEAYNAGSLEDARNLLKP